VSSCPCDGTIQVFRFNSQVFDFLSYGCEPRAWCCDSDGPEDQDSAFCRDIEVVGVRNVSQRFLRQRNLVLRGFFREHGRLINEVQISYFTASWQGEMPEWQQVGLISFTRFGQAGLDESSSRVNNAGECEGQIGTHRCVSAGVPLGLRIQRRGGSRACRSMRIEENAYPSRR
jgi:hypothetical protein